MRLAVPYPECCDLMVDADGASVSFALEESFAYFEGHFPGNPIVPAVVQVGWILEAISVWEAERPERYRLSRFKFVAPVRPGMEISVSLSRSGDRFACRILADGQLCCSGNVTLAE